MAPSTRSRTGAIPSGSRKRMAESDDEAQPDASLAPASQPRTGARKRTKRTHDDAEVQAPKPAARAPPQKVRGLLKALPAMPLDVLEEIFTLCDPATLVSVARTTKAFCRLLQSSAFAYVWREAFAVNADIPPAPDGWSLVQWASLLFGERCCQSCLITKVDTISFGILKRLCERCIRANLTECTESKMVHNLKSWSLSLYIPTATIRELVQTRFRGAYTNEYVFAYQSDLDTLVAGLQAAIESGDQDGREYLPEQRKLVEDRRNHASHAEKWYRAKIEREAKQIEDAKKARKRELKDAKEERRDEIMRRIREAGYDTRKDITGVLKLKGIHVAQPLTEDDWKQLWPSIEPLVKASKAKRLAERAESRLKDRITSAEIRLWGHWTKLEMTQRERAFWPSMERMPHFEPMASFLKLDVEQTPYGRQPDDWYDRLEELFGPTVDTIRRTIRELDLDLARKIAFPRVSSQNDDTERLIQLATSVFTVGKSKSSAPNDVYVYFGREVLLAARDHVTWLEDHPFSDPLPATFSEAGSAVVRRILEICKLKLSTTILELDNHDAHFICTTCDPKVETPNGSPWGKQLPCRRVLSWRTAVEHACHTHGDAGPNSFDLRFLDKDERTLLGAKSYKKIARYCDHNIKHVVPNCFRCNHCDDDTNEIPRNRQTAKHGDGLLTLREVLKHLQNKHNITVGAAKENADYWYHPRLRRGLLKSTTTEFRLIV
ncbi:unnamed protein product [Peniophora sp. CBMAI 1063]|nr:unnamed protein product [Peniophora sp. CBMAI 1063]